jgi:nicotinamide-nucleotide amidase
MKPMFDTLVLPRLPASGQAIVRHEVHCFGAGESAIEAALGDLTARGRDPEVGITAHEATITLRIAATAATPEESRAKIDQTVALIRERLGRFVFGEQGQRLEQVVTGMLAARGATLAVVEGGTAGLLAQWLTDARTLGSSRAGGPGNSAAGGGTESTPSVEHDVFLGGIVVRAATAPRVLPLATPVAPGERLTGREATIALAIAGRDQFGSDFALAVSRWFEPNADRASSEVETAWVALAGPQGATAEELPLLGDPAISRSRVAKAALNLLRLHLLALA